MDHAGFDGLHNPMGFLLIMASFMLLIFVMIVGAYFVKLAQAREKEVRAKLRQDQIDKQSK